MEGGLLLFTTILSLIPFSFGLLSPFHVNTLKFTLQFQLFPTFPSFVHHSCTTVVLSAPHPSLSSLRVPRDVNETDSVFPKNLFLLVALQPTAYGIMSKTNLFNPFQHFKEHPSIFPPFFWALCLFMSLSLLPQTLRSR